MKISQILIVAAQQSGMTLNEMAEKSGLNYSTVRSMLLTLDDGTPAMASIEKIDTLAGVLLPACDVRIALRVIGELSTDYDRLKEVIEKAGSSEVETKLGRAIIEKRPSGEYIIKYFDSLKVIISPDEFNEKCEFFGVKYIP